MSCSTCRNYRQGVAAKMGFCSLDRGREPLTGDEIRACWQAPIVAEPPVGLFAMVEAMSPRSERELPSSPARPAPVRVRPVRYLRWTPAAHRAPERELVAVPIVDDGEGSDPAVAAPATPAATAAPAPTRAQAAERRPSPWTVPVEASARTPGRLLEAPRVSPALRLQSRDDPRSIRDADLSPRGTLGRTRPVPTSDADGERDNPLQGAPVS